MLRHACGFGLTNADQDTRAAPSLSRAPKYPAHGGRHRAVARAVQPVLAGL